MYKGNPNSAIQKAAAQLFKVEQKCIMSLFYMIYCFTQGESSSSYAGRSNLTSLLNGQLSPLSKISSDIAHVFSYYFCSLTG